KPPAANRLQSFFDRTSYNIALSSVRSATIFFSRLFSSSSWRMRLTQTAIALLPVVERRVADACLAAHLRDGRSFIRLAQNECDLRLRELRLLHGILLLPSSGS